MGNLETKIELNKNDVHLQFLKFWETGTLYILPVNINGHIW